jgi:hypothetical protein
MLLPGKAAEAELKSLTDQGFNLEDSDLIRHNVVVFRCGWPHHSPESGVVLSRFVACLLSATATTRCVCCLV